MANKQVCYTIVFGEILSHELGEIPLFNTKEECVEYAKKTYPSLNPDSWNLLKVKLSVKNKN